MPAQNGSAVLLTYGVQPLAPAVGQDVQLVYTPDAVVPGASRRVFKSSIGRWSASKKEDATTTGAYPKTTVLALNAETEWPAVGDQTTHRTGSGWGVSDHRDNTRHSAWKKPGKSLRFEGTQPWGKSKPADEMKLSPWIEKGISLRHEPRSTWSLSQPQDVGQHGIWGLTNPFGGSSFILLHGKTTPRDKTNWIPWLLYSRPLSPGWGVVTPPTGPDTDPDGTVVIPVRRTYIVINEVRMLRVSDQRELPIQTLSLSIDHETWTWGATATLPISCQADVMPVAYGEPVELDLIIKDEVYRVLAEKIGRDREFGKAVLKLTCRGHAAYLSSPYSPILSFSSNAALTAQQLMNTALTTNGASLGWAVDWGIDDWLVPAGVWGKQGSYIDGVKDIAEAVGAYIQADPVFKTLKVLPKYPVLPWEWGSATPDIQLPSSVVDKESIEWMEYPQYNSVFVSGTAGGVVGRIIKAGSAADIVAPMATHQLITATAALRQRGSAILGQTGKTMKLSLSLPVLDDIGIIPPGKLVRYMDNGVPVIGLTRGVSVQMNSQPVLRQTIEVEVHG